MLEEDTPQWEHTVWIMAKVRCRTTHINVDNAGDEALDDPSEWYVKSLRVHTSQQHNPGHSSYSLDISHGGLLDEKIVSRVFKLATSVLISTILSQSQLRNSSSHTDRGQLQRHQSMDTTSSQSICQSTTQNRIPTLEQV